MSKASSMANNKCLPCRFGGIRLSILSAFQIIPSPVLRNSTADLNRKTDRSLGSFGTPWRSMIVFTYDAAWVRPCWKGYCRCCRLLISERLIKYRRILYWRSVVWNRTLWGPQRIKGIQWWRTVICRCSSICRTTRFSLDIDLRIIDLLLLFDRLGFEGFEAILFRPNTTPTQRCWCWRESAKTMLRDTFNSSDRLGSFSAFTT